MQHRLQHAKQYSVLWLPLCYAANIQNQVAKRHTHTQSRCDEMTVHMHPDCGNYNRMLGYDIT